MPQKVQAKKKKMNIGIAIFTVILSAIPVGIVACTGLSSFQTPYGIYALAMLGIGVYFSCIFGMFAWKNKVLYIIMDTINVLASLGLVVYGYINFSYRGGLLLHIAAALLFTLGIYQTGDSEQGDNFYTRYLVPIVTDVAGLIFVLWFISVKMNVIAHIVIVSVINFFTLAIFLIPSFVKLFYLGKRALDDIANDEVEYEEETEEEIAAKKEAKIAKKQAASEKPKKTSKSNADVAGDTTRWTVYSAEIDRILWQINRQYNNAIDEINGIIRANNDEIRHAFSIERLDRASKSNKEIGKHIRYLKRNFKCINKNLEKLREREFTAKDKYKSFVYHLLSGRMKVRKSDEECPTLRVASCRVWSKIYTSSLDNWLVEMVFEGEDIYLVENN